MIPFLKVFVAAAVFGAVNVATVKPDVPAKVKANPLGDVNVAVQVSSELSVNVAAAVTVILPHDIPLVSNVSDPDIDNVEEIVGVPEVYFNVPPLIPPVYVNVTFPAKFIVPDTVIPPADDHVPPVNVIFIVPVVVVGTDHPAQLRTSVVVLLIVHVPVAIVSWPVIVQSPTSVFVLAPVMVTGPGKVFPLLVMVDVADIFIDPVPETVHEC